MTEFQYLMFEEGFIADDYNFYEGLVFNDEEDYEIPEEFMLDEDIPF